MLACPLAEERKVRKRWAAAIRTAIEKYATDDAVVNAIMACWATNNKGDIYDAVKDEDNDWCVPEIERVGESGWRFTPDSGRPPTFDPSVYWGANADTDDDDSTAAIVVRSERRPVTFPKTMWLGRTVRPILVRSAAASLQAADGVSEVGAFTSLNNSALKPGRRA